MNKTFELEPSLYDKLTNVKLGCDRPLTHREIKPPFQNCNFFYSIIGSPGSGKTSFLFSLLTTKSKTNRIYYKVFKDIIYVCPKNSRDSVLNNPLEDLETVFEQLDESVKDAIIDNKKKYEDEYDENYQQLLIIDDCSSDLKKIQNINLLSELSKNRRHMNLSIILLVQYLRDIPRSIRSQNTLVVVFKPANNLDFETLRKEFINLPTEIFNNLMRFIFVNRHDNLIVDKTNETYYKNLQKIIINE